MTFIPFLAVSVPCFIGLLVLVTALFERGEK
jgi:hypothetical protein